MISVIENQHSEPSMQICQYNIQDGILFTICGRSVYLTVFMGRKGQMFESGISHIHTEWHCGPKYYQWKGYQY